MFETQQLLDQYIPDHVFPGAVVGLTGVDGPFFTWSAGRTTYQDDAPRVNQYTLYDTASLTKTIPTATLALILEKEGIWKLNDTLSQWVPEWEGDAKLTLEDLVCFRPEFTLTLSELKNETADSLRSKIFSAQLAAPLRPDHQTYSNTTSILLTRALERATQLTLPELAQQGIFEPLGMMQTSWPPVPREWDTTIAPSEVDPWRGREIHNEIHDESAWKLHQGGWTVGSAGLHSNVHDLLRFLRNHLQNSLGDTRGWEGYSATWMGQKTPKSAYGKTGFTGCFLLVLPEQQAGIVMLSNATYPQRGDRSVMNNARKALISSLFSSGLLEKSAETSTMSPN